MYCRVNKYVWIVSALRIHVRVKRSLGAMLAEVNTDNEQGV